MRNLLPLSLSVIAASALIACAPHSTSQTLATPRTAGVPQSFQVLQQLIASPDMPDWQTARQTISLASGDRVLDAPEEDVYRAAMTAFATMELTIHNTERSSGLIDTTGAGQILPSAERQRLRKQLMTEFGLAHGLSADDAAALADPNARTTTTTSSSHMTMHIGMSMGAWEPGYAPTLSVTMYPIKDRTKVKLRIGGVTYPEALALAYKSVWNGIDKQLFLDRNLDEAKPTATPTPAASPDASGAPAATVQGSVQGGVQSGKSGKK